MPTVKKGKKASQDGGPTCTQQFAALKKSGRHRYIKTTTRNPALRFYAYSFTQYPLLYEICGFGFMPPLLHHQDVEAD